MLQYLGIETTGFDSEKDKVITVQFAKMNFKTGMVIPPVVVIAEWDSSEEDILKKAYSFLMEGNQWDFVPCGYNILHFDLPFLFSRFQTVLGKEVSYEFLDRPSLDLKTTFILMNGGRFTGQNRFIQKNEDGSIIPELYKRKEHTKILKHIQSEIYAFGEAFSELRNRLNLS